MAVRIDHEAVLHGELDCTQRGAVRGKIWLQGWEVPLMLDLEGFPHADLAGRSVRFTNPEKPLKDGPVDLDASQVGVCGDTTGSLRLESHDLQSGSAPEIINALCIEWYVPDGDRIILELPDAQTEVSEGAWNLGEEEETKGRLLRQEALISYVQKLKGDDPPEVPEDREMSEFEWETFMKASDRRTDAVLELHDKLGYSEEAEYRIAQIMGWGTSDTPDANDDEEELPSEDYFEPDSLEHIRNPLSERISKILEQFGTSDGERSQVGESASYEFEFTLMRLSAKLAGALDKLVVDGEEEEIDSDPGFTIACLKRCLPIIDEALSLRENANIDESVVAEIFSVRQEVMDEMTRLRHI